MPPFVQFAVCKVLVNVPGNGIGQGRGEEVELKGVSRSQVPFPVWLSLRPHGLNSSEKGENHPMIP